MNQKYLAKLQTLRREAMKSDQLEVAIEIQKRVDLLSREIELLSMPSLEAHLLSNKWVFDSHDNQATPETHPKSFGIPFKYLGGGRALFGDKPVAFEILGDEHVVHEESKVVATVLMKFNAERTVAEGKDFRRTYRLRMIKK